MCHSCRKLQLSAHLVNIQTEIASDSETLCHPSWEPWMEEMYENIQQSDNEHPNSQTSADNQITQFTHILYTLIKELPVDDLQVHYHCSKTLIFLLLLLYNMLIIKLSSEENADGRNLKIRKLHNDPDGKGDSSLRRSERRSQAEQNICCL